MSDTFHPKSFTYEELLCTEDGQRSPLQDELLVPVEAASYAKVRISIHLACELGAFLDKKTSRVIFGAFSVYLFYGREDVPDEYQKPILPGLMVVCDLTKLDEECYKGAPDLVIEILPESNRGDAEDRKFAFYEMAGVREYWVVNPTLKLVHVYLLEGDRFSNVVHLYRETDKLPVTVLPGCVIDLEEMFADAELPAAESSV